MRERCFASGKMDLNCPWGIGIISGMRWGRGWVGCNEAVGTSKENTYERWCTKN